jgi:uncharacterized protein
MNMENKVVVITGGSSGLGRETALRLSRKKATVILVARTAATLEDTGQEIAGLTGAMPLALVCDISSEHDVDRMAQRIGEVHSHVDVLINNAGFGTYTASESLSNREMREHFAVNFFGAYYCTKALLPLIKKSSAGYILNIGSAFSITALAENSVYAATKFALRGFTIGLRHELQFYGIGAGLFLPGPMETPFQRLRKQKALRAPGFLCMKPRVAAARVERMIHRRKKECVSPGWMPTLLRLKRLSAYRPP